MQLYYFQTIFCHVFNKFFSLLICIYCLCGENRMNIGTPLYMFCSFISFWLILSYHISGVVAYHIFVFAEVKTIIDFKRN